MNLANITKADWSQERFEEIEGKIRIFLRSIGYKDKVEGEMA